VRWRLRLAPWPFTGRVAVREGDPYRALAEIHVLDQWRYLGRRARSELAALLEQRSCRLRHRSLPAVEPASEHARRPLPVVDLERRAPRFVW
jgi:hypothetical protein